jgi:DNA-directed RNA polymerase subunit RPC12/RpoP
MTKKKTRNRAHFRILCTTCGETIRENANSESYGQCLKCFYRSLAAWLRSQRRVVAGEFVSDR